MDRIKAFYETIDRETVYTPETCAAEHPFYPLLISFIEKWGLKHKHCLEIGSSKGLFQNMVYDYTGVDIAENLRRFYLKPYTVTTGAHLPFCDASFDGIFSYATHEHIPDIETALNEIIRILKPGGVCLFAPAWHTRSWFAQGYAVRPYSDLPLRDRLIKFSIPFRDFVLLRWPAVFLRRLFRLFLYLLSSHTIPLRYKRLRANYDKFWQSDSDACNSLDPFDVILWLRSRGIHCFNQENFLKILLVRCLALEFQKPFK